VARAGDELDAEPFDVVVGVVQRVDFEFAAIARAGIDLADGQRLAENGKEFVLDALAFDAQRAAEFGRRFAADALACDLFEDAPRQRSCPA